MGQARLNHLMTLNIYKSTLDLVIILPMNLFVVVNTGTQAQGVRELLTACMGRDEFGSYHDVTTAAGGCRRGMFPLPRVARKF